GEQPPGIPEATAHRQDRRSTRAAERGAGTSPPPQRGTIMGCIYSGSCARREVRAVAGLGAARVFDPAVDQAVAFEEEVLDAAILQPVAPARQHRGRQRAPRLAVVLG